MSTEYQRAIKTVLGQLEASVRNLHKQIDADMPDILFCLETGRHEALFSLCRGALCRFESRQASREYSIESIRQWQAML